VPANAHSTGSQLVVDVLEPRHHPLAHEPDLIGGAELLDDLVVRAQRVAHGFTR
jgi:hypothetical protein